MGNSWELVKKDDGTNTVVRIFRRGQVWWGSYIALGAATVNGRQKQTRATLRQRSLSEARKEARRWDDLIQRSIDPVEHDCHVERCTATLVLISRPL